MMMIYDIVLSSTYRNHLGKCQDGDVHEDSESTVVQLPRKELPPVVIIQSEDLTVLQSAEYNINLQPCQASPFHPTCQDSLQRDYISD